jgi:hypothetical protein
LGRSAKVARLDPRGLGPAERCRPRLGGIPVAAQ